ncbi:hypothetical protein PIROE2DRAFT_16216 [Piromyces sp. E2]|nr:hypothetical protein PIROE2DRAFT_16216 [Piromyces sp. E2]|eukprot:OUM58493.1 hypothetical protein PIROE2DRAFT_16216 [Piromyces sp. E2]
MYIVRSNIKKTNALLVAFKYGYYNLVKYLIEQRVDINTKGYDHSNSSILLEACTKGNDKEYMVKYLVEHGANVNIEFKGYTPLIEAFKHGVDVNYVFENRLPISYVREECIKMFFLDHGFNIKGYELNMLENTSEDDDVVIVEFLLEHGVDVNKTESLYKACTPNQNLFSEVIVATLIDYKADVYKNGPLIGACQTSHKNIMEYLIEHGADLNTKHVNQGNWLKKCTPLDYAYKNGNENIKSYLLEHKANLYQEK